jgi:hypothetical protein
MYIRRIYKSKKIIITPYFRVTSFKSGTVYMVVHSPPHEQTLGLDKRLQLSSPVLIEVDMKEIPRRRITVTSSLNKYPRISWKIHKGAGVTPPCPRPLASEHAAYLKTT